MCLRWVLVVGGLTMAACAFQVQAITEDLNCGYLSNLTPNNGCQVGSTNNDKLEPTLQVNDDNMFGEEDWMFAEEWQYSYGAWAQGDQEIDVGLIITGNGTAGTWAITGVWDNVMLVLKGPNGTGTAPQNYVAYLLEAGDTSGSFSSPFKKNGTVQSISNITAYVRGVPEPTALALLGVALGAFAISASAKRRRRTRTA